MATETAPRPVRRMYWQLPVFALGGLRREDLDAAQQAGAHGIAAIRAAWD